MKKQKKAQDRSYILAVLLLLLSGFFLFLFLTPDSKSKNHITGPNSKEYEARVNKHLFQTSQKIEHSREKMEVETSRLATSGVPTIEKTPETALGVDFSADPRAEALVQTLGRDVKESSGPKNSHELIQTELFEQERLQEYSEEYKKEFARQFIENAKKAGFNVKLNDQYKVISVTPVRKPAEDFKLFDTGGGSAR